jgi:hypothetical protein
MQGLKEDTSMKKADSTNLLTLIDSADEHGRICLYVPKTEPMRTKDHAREWLSTVFMHNALLTLRLDRVKKAITEIDLVLAPAGENHTALVINLAKLLQLPGTAPAEELAAFRELVVAMRAFYEAHPTENVDIQLCNERDRNGRVYGSIACRIPEHDDKGTVQVHTVKADEAASASLQARIDGNLALSHWLRQVALSLQKIGPWSWAIVRGEDLFGYNASPWFKHSLAHWTRLQGPPAPAPEMVILDV